MDLHPLTSVSSSLLIFSSFHFVTIKKLNSIAAVQGFDLRSTRLSIAVCAYGAKNTRRLRRSEGLCFLFLTSSSWEARAKKRGRPLVFVLAAAYIVHVDLVLFNVHVLDHSLSVATASLRFWFCAPGCILAHFQQIHFHWFLTSFANLVVTLASTRVVVCLKGCRSSIHLTQTHSLHTKGSLL